MQNKIIKFRAWDKEKFIHCIAGEALPGFEKMELMQFTGLTDKLGKEIYEGDIVRVFREGQGHVAREVVWDSRKGHWFLLGAGLDEFNPFSELYDELRTCEVIGNARENRNLLK